jgi:hypothetical protein
MHAETNSAMLSDPGFEPEFNRYSLRIWIVLSMLISLAMISIFAKYEMVSVSIIPFLVIPIALTLYFKNRIARLGAWAFAGTVVAVLSAAVLFGL